MAGEKILVVDDHPDIIELLQEGFRRKGFEVVGAGNGQEALAKVYQEHPDLILLDIMMPLFDGYEICQTLKAQEETKNIPVVFITAKDKQPDIEQGFNLKADGYVVKPFDPFELADFVSDILHRVHH